MWDRCSFNRSTTTLKHTPPFEEPLKVIASRHIFKRLRYKLEQRFCCSLHMLSWHNVNVSLGHLTLTQTMLYLKECFRVNMKMHEYSFHSKIFFVTDLWGTRFISVGRRWGQTVQQIHKTTHRDFQDTCCCLLQPCYSSWANIKLSCIKTGWARPTSEESAHAVCGSVVLGITGGVYNDFWKASYCSRPTRNTRVCYFIRHEVGSVPILVPSVSPSLCIITVV